ncbi:hypothetical protein [Corynebacterium heidelbergense]|nr:hypothetical protein [Corynebacterium heidelbergense]WCZ36986.1 hypothetical protein CHEID_07265 [Corynebacterium heidelbergense]
MTTRQVDWRYKQTVARERRRLERNPEHAVCWLCGEPINMQLPPHHERAFTLDHIVPIARGGDLHGETKPAHRNCNAARGNKREATNPNTLLDW